MAQDRNENYLQAIRQNLTPQTQIIVCVVPNDKKDRYDAIKKSCCIDNPGMIIIFFTQILLNCFLFIVLYWRPGIFMVQ